MPTNFLNRTLYTGDNLEVMRGMNSETVDLIYLDPPFNSKRTYHAPIGSQAKGASFNDIWSMDDIKEDWIEDLQIAYPQLWLAVEGGAVHSVGMKAYLAFMAIRLIEMLRLLKPTGSLWLHCDPAASHYLKHLLDVLFLPKGKFINEIVWKRLSAANKKGSQHNARKFGTSTDHIFAYGKTDRYFFKPLHLPPDYAEMQRRFPHVDEKGRYSVSTPLFRTPSMGARPNLCYEYNGVRNPTPSGWRVSRERLAELDAAGEIIWREGKRPQRKKYAEDFMGDLMPTLWDDISPAVGAERTGYPTQKPILLMERIIECATESNGMVLDPFCGCATTCIAAEKKGRQWVGIDIEPEARNLVEERLTKAADDGALLKLAHEKYPKVVHSTKPPKRTDPEAPTRSKNIKAKLFREQDGRCAGRCFDGRIGRRLELDLFEVDHIVPRSKNGADIDDNLQLLCPTCNGRKGNRSMDYLLERNLLDGRDVFESGSEDSVGGDV